MIVSCAAKARTDTTSEHPSTGSQKRFVSMPQDCEASHSPLCTKPPMATSVASKVAIGITRPAQYGTSSQRHSRMVSSGARERMIGFILSKVSPRKMRTANNPRPKAKGRANRPTM